MLKPVSPYIFDAVAHIFNYTQHLATAHYENGKLHVHKEIVDNAKKSEPAKEAPASKKENAATDYISLVHKQFIPHLQAPKSYPLLSSATLLYNYLAGEYPPPRA